MSEQIPPNSQQQFEPTPFDRAVSKQNSLLGSVQFRATMLEEENKDLKQALAERDEKIMLLEAQLAPFLVDEPQPEASVLPCSSEEEQVPLSEEKVITNGNNHSAAEPV